MCSDRSYRARYIRSDVLSTEAQLRSSISGLYASDAFENRVCHFCRAESGQRDNHLNGMRRLSHLFTAVTTLLLLLFQFEVSGAVLFVRSPYDGVQEGTLRSAVIRANHIGGYNTIVLRRGLYRLSLKGADEEAARTGDLDITHGNVAIVGYDGPVVIDASRLGDRAFHVHSKARLMLVGISIKGSQSASGINWSGEPGGAVQNEGTLTMFNCKLTGNIAQSDFGDGGAIWNSGVLGLYRCVISSNQAGRLAGGIWNSGFASLNYCNVSSNFAVGCHRLCGGTYEGGGGIFNSGRMILNNSSVAANSTGSGIDGFSGNGGQLSGGFPGDNGSDGGGIYNSGDLKLLACLVSGNFTGSGGNGGSGFYGGGSGGAGGGGGGIYSSSNLMVISSTICSNSTGQGGSAGDAFFTSAAGGTGGSGGGVYSVGILALTNSTISGNSTGSGGNGGHGDGNGGPGADGGFGGGIFASGPFSFVSSTICSNRTAAGGNGGSATLFGWVIGADNQTNGGSGGNSGSGAGVYAVQSNNQSAANTLIALNHPESGGTGGSGFVAMWNTNTQDFDVVDTTGNAGQSGTGPDLVGPIVSSGFNLVGQSDGTTFNNTSSTDFIGNALAPINPLLGPLRMNGGTTATHALLFGSPAIDQGNAFGLKVDQRGYKRPIDNSAIPNASNSDGSDIGAFESTALGR